MQDLNAHPLRSALVFSRSMSPVTSATTVLLVCMHAGGFLWIICLSITARQPCFLSDQLRQVPSASPRYPNLMLPYDYILQG